MRSCCSGRTGDGRSRAISVAKRSEKRTAYPALVYREHSRRTQERSEESKKRLVRSLLLKKRQIRLRGIEVVVHSPKHDIQNGDASVRVGDAMAASLYPIQNNRSGKGAIGPARDDYVGAVFVVDIR
jgi:hypothetical protein